MERKAHLEDDADAIVLLSGEFHLLLADIAGNTALRRFLEDIVARESLIIQLFGKPGKDDCSDDEHARIVAALKSGHQGRIAEEIEQHIDRIAARLDLETKPMGERNLADILGAK